MLDMTCEKSTLLIEHSLGGAKVARQNHQYGVHDSLSGADLIHGSIVTTSFKL